MLEELEKKGIGKAGVQYKMKDWAFNRQRYWGEPIPLDPLPALWCCCSSGRRTSASSAGCQGL